MSLEYQTWLGGARILNQYPLGGPSPLDWGEELLTLVADLQNRQAAVNMN
jgi:hypothetical protein